MADLIKVTGLWKNKSKDGVTYLSGNWGSVRVLIFQNSYKAEGDKQPDMIMHFGQVEKKDGEKEKTEDQDDPFL